MTAKTIKQRESAPHKLPDYHPILARVLTARGIDDPSHLERDLKRLLPYEGLKGMDEAVCILAEAVQSQKNIVIIGDFDADGATSTALAVCALKALGGKHISFLVPNRFEFGYGLTPEIVIEATRLNPDIIVTVDNGISSCDGVAKANALGIQVVVTDHHLAGDALPDAAAIVNPNQPGDSFESKNLAGVGVIFYVMLALRNHLREKDWFKKNNLPEPNMGSFLDLVALGTVADVVPLDKNNRILVYQGLGRIRRGRCRPGIKALIEIAGRKIHRLIAQDLSFAVAPRLNAAGRLDDMSYGIACLLTDDMVEAQRMAKELDELNQERRVIESEMKEQAFDILKKLTLEDNAVPDGICLFDENWHQGVIGIVASRIKEKFHRPVIAFAVNDNMPQEIKGSARSINGVHIRDALDRIAKQHPDLISKFGGHAMAAGLTILKKDFKRFQTIFAKTINDILKDNPIEHVIYSDGELQPEEINLPLAELLRESGPWGQAFPEPIFNGRFQLVEQRIVGANHLKMTLGVDAGGMQVDAIAFNVDIEKWPNERETHIQAAYKLDINEFRSKRKVQLIIEHFEAG